MSWRTLVLVALSVILFKVLWVSASHAANLTQTKIAFTSIRNANSDIYVMNSDGSGQTRLTSHLAYDAKPSWSPDGAKIAFISDREGAYLLYIMNSDGSHPTVVTQIPTVEGGDPPSWSPDGTLLAFTSNNDGNLDISVVSLDGLALTRLTNNLSQERQPSWSPDGTQIAFASDRDGDWDIYVMNADGSNPINLTPGDTPHNYTDLEPSWSPDGTQIAFISDRDGRSAIFTMNIDGSQEIRITDPEDTYNLSPSWSPDGTRLAVRAALVGANWNIYVMNADGTDFTNLTETPPPAFDFDPAWSPFLSTESFVSLALEYGISQPGATVSVSFTLINRTPHRSVDFNAK